MEKAGLLAGGAFTKCEPSAAGRIWKRGAAEWVSDELFNKKARRKRYVACDELEGTVKIDISFPILVGFFINFALPVFAQYAILPFLVFPSHTNLCSLHEHLIQAFLFVVDQSIHTCAHAE